MSKLIDQLKKEHVAILGVLAQVKELKVGSKEARDKLLAAKAGLLAHLKKEDAELYPALKKAAQSDPALKQRLDALAHEMAAVSNEALKFFDKHTRGEPGIEFAMDAGALFGRLKARMQREESVIYCDYDALPDSKRFG